jgi:chorismate mutase
MAPVTDTFFTRLLAKKGQPLLIAGPCSAETEEQVMATAHGLTALGKIDLFRAGIWKPRTRPGSFEGMGAVALPWLQRVKAETGLPTAIEVATPRHVEEALRHGIDVLWVVPAVCLRCRS